MTIHRIKTLDGYLSSGREDPTSYSSRMVELSGDNLTRVTVMSGSPRGGHLIITPNETLYSNKGEQAAVDVSDRQARYTEAMAIKEGIIDWFTQLSIEMTRHTRARIAYDHTRYPFENGFEIFVCDPLDNDTPDPGYSIFVDFRGRAIGTVPTEGGGRRELDPKVGVADAGISLLTTRHVLEERLALSEQGRGWPSWLAPSYRRILS